MNFSGIAYNSWIGKLLRLPLRYIPKNTVLPVIQGELRGYKWISGSSNHGCWLGSYEYEKQRLISSMIKPGTVAFDIGAHVGFYTLLFSKLIGPEGKVFAFEPFPPNIDFLRKHISMNRIANVETLEVAVSDAEGTTLFTQGPGSSMGYISETGDFEVEQVAIDGLIRRKKLSPPNYIKIDIEGAEYKALIGAKETLRKFHPVIFLATHGREVHKSCCDFLTDLGYALNPIDGSDILVTDEIVANLK
jgi:FkbM family methyltransferase